MLGIDFKGLLLQIGINDISIAAQMIVGLSNTGPNFKAAAQAAIIANEALGQAALNPKE